MIENITVVNLKIQGNSNRPEVDFNAKTGELVLTGRSILENTLRFYEPILDWIDTYCKNPAENTSFHLKLEYFNTSTSKFLLSIIEKLEELYSGGSDVKIYWYYVDEDMQELGEDYRNIVELPFQLIAFSMN
ncbi:MAG: DUF1987 domain-containing protein [Salinivirgaceae bacterium]|nr:DUF1987 domain-containing protein [Salinivirgaceae bacterium]